MSGLRGSLPRASYLITLRIILSRTSLVLLSIILVFLLTSSSLSVSRQYSHHQAKLTRFKLSFDRAATYVFPFMFFLFNAGYWTVYLVIMPNFIQYGIPEWFYQVYLSTWSTWDPSVTLPDYLLDTYVLMIYRTIHLMVYLGQLNPIQDPWVTPMLKLWSSELYNTRFCSFERSVESGFVWVTCIGYRIEVIENFCQFSIHQSKIKMRAYSNIKKLHICCLCSKWKQAAKHTY